MIAAKIGHIARGWLKRFGFLDITKAEQKLSNLRLKRCGTCEHAKRSKLLELINGTAKKEDRLVCTLCHCPCLEKSLVVDESCPVDRW